MNQTNILYKKSNQETNYLFRRFISSPFLCQHTGFMRRIYLDIVNVHHQVRYVTYCVHSQVDKAANNKIFSVTKLALNFLASAGKKNSHKQYSTLLYPLQSGLIGIENHAKSVFGISRKSELKQLFIRGLCYLPTVNFAQRRCQYTL